MKQTVTESMFIDQVGHNTAGSGFTYAGLIALYEAIEELENDCDMEREFYPGDIRICYSQYTLAELLENFTITLEDIIEEVTSTIHTENNETEFYNCLQEIISNLPDKDCDVDEAEEAIESIRESLADLDELIVKKEDISTEDLVSAIEDDEDILDRITYKLQEHTGIVCRFDTTDFIIEDF